MRAGLAALAAAALGGLALVASRSRASESGEKKSILEIVGMGDVMGSLKPAADAPRGIRNNNPLNIERNHIDWYGMAADQSGDPRFIVFDDPRYGYRAAARILDSYNGRGVTTLADILSTWAPSHENNVGAYVAHVAQRSGIDATQHVEREDYPALLDAMTWHENGENPYPLELIDEGVRWAYG